MRPGQRFLPHGHKVSLGLVFADAEFASAPLAARDASLFDQQGCLSPHGFYVVENPVAYAAALAVEMEKFEATTPRSPITPGESSTIRALRDSYAFRIAAGEPMQLWTSQTGTAWTVIYDPTPGFPASPLNRVVFVKPMPASPTPVPHLSTIGLWPATPENARRALAFAPIRLCRLGEMQNPPWTWHQDGEPSLAPLVTWIDFAP
ncbi:MAG: acyl-CoA reductase [Chthoniobacteraceae bacterium]